MGITQKNNNTFYWMDLTYLQTKQPYTYFSNQVEKYAY